MFGFLFKKSSKKSAEITPDSIRVDLNEDAPPSTPPSSGEKLESIVKPAAPPDPPPSQIPSQLKVGAEMRAVPEKQPGTPRAWSVRIFRVDHEGIWISRMPTSTTPMDLQVKEILSLVFFDDKKQLSFDCPVLRVRPGNPEQVCVGPPVKTSQENSKIGQTSNRKHYRLEFRIPCEVRFPNQPSSTPAMRCHTRDISNGGLALDTDRAFDEGTELDVRILSLSFPLNLRCRVVRTIESEPGQRTIALAFPDNMSSITKELISQFILENQRGR